MAIALLASVSHIANLAVGAVLFVWFCVALVFMFAALPRWGMPVVGAIGMVGAVVLALVCVWLTAEGSR
ncbi:hypothetical protein [Haliangium sp. UPWRP_2]|uniref:hypothetical protein n=1 Tax=Haliangium sp. UPWRP_2 TaxID=1931276 RepID=UPI000B542D8B|nr:hypothetical protein [Haliangium sp. UPWRP_2]PSM31594.1 hypothetical protein BVG81_004555 [Haliangium sp. UPWRP_2]